MKEQFNVLYAEGARTGMMMNVGLHPHVIGVPHRAGILAQVSGLRKSNSTAFGGRHGKRWRPAIVQQHATHIPPQAKPPVYEQRFAITRRIRHDAQRCSSSAR